MQIDKVENPIFIVGTGRCGSTVFHQSLSYHEHLAWLSRYCETRPHKPRANWCAMRMLDSPLPSRYLRKLIYPVEAYSFWNYYCPGFGSSYRDLLKGDVTPRVKQRVQGAMVRMLTQKRDRLLIKITGWPRIGFLKEIFPDAKFIHVYRDGRAVVNSLLAVRWWSGWRGPANWRWGELAEPQRERWERYGRSFLALAAIEWEILMAAQETAGQRIPADDLLEIRYEDLCQEPERIFREAIEFCELDWLPKFEAMVSELHFKNMNYKWREHLTQDQQQILYECLGDTLQRYGYF